MCRIPLEVSDLKFVSIGYSVGVILQGTVSAAFIRL